MPVLGSCRFQDVIVAGSRNYQKDFRSLRRSIQFLAQAQRDYFGAHTYERIDAKGTFHTEWEKL